MCAYFKGIAINKEKEICLLNEEYTKLSLI